MVKIDRAAMHGVVEDFANNNTTAQQQLLNTENAFQQISQDENFLGQGAENFKDFLDDGVLAVIKGLTSTMDETERLLKETDNSFDFVDNQPEAVIGTKKLNEVLTVTNSATNKVNGAIDTMVDAARSARKVCGSDRITIPKLPMRFSFKSLLLNLDIKQLDSDIRAWDRTHQNDFKEIKQGLTAIKEMLETIKDLSLGGDVTDYSQSSSAAQKLRSKYKKTSRMRELSIRQIKKIVGELKKPNGMSDNDFKKYKTEIYRQAQGQSRLGWPEASIQAYATYLNDHVDSVLSTNSQMSPKALVTELTAPANTVGSDLFRSMWDKFELSNRSNLEKQNSARDKLAVLIQVVNIPKGELDGSAKQTRELLERFDSDLKPTDPFWGDLASTVQSGFPKGIGKWTDDITLRRQVHQLRYVISAQQTQYVRAKYSDGGKKTDREALIDYLIAEGQYDLGESARLHQKVDEDGNRFGGEDATNIKIVQGFHSEFILNSKGEFLNEIDPTKDSDKNIEGVVNGSSFNYGKNNEDGGMHKELDVRYKTDDPNQDFDPSFRKKITAKYSAPDPDEYISKEVDNIKKFGKKGEGLSGKELNQRAVAEFKSELRFKQGIHTKSTK